MLRNAIMLVLAGAIATPATAQFKPDDGHIRVSREAIVLQYQEQLKALRRDMVAARTADGGTLTTAHLAAFQLRLDRLNADYRLAVKNADPWSVNANGSRRY